jgi:hypothetical protein
MKASRLAALGAAVVLAGCAGGGDPDETPAPAAAPAGQWERVEPGGRTRCARGGDYAFWIRAGDPKKLVLFFQGGGGCFDPATCAEGSSWFDDRVGAEDDPAGGRGMLDLADERNPFHDWSWVYIPSCTGDVHIGDARVDYGNVVVEQRGWQNARAALRRAYREFGGATTVLVAGCSAGSVGSAWHAEDVIRHYPGAKVAQLGDSLAFLFHRPIRLADWGTNRHFPSFFRPGDRRWTMEEFTTSVARAHPEATFARFNHAADGVQQRFYEAVGGNGADFEPRLRAVERRLKALPNYRSYLACGGEHCALPTEEFTWLRVDGLLLRDWVRDLATGRDVDCPECPG